jgi:gamma-glutamyl phosphate reductase
VENAETYEKEKNLKITQSEIAAKLISLILESFPEITIQAILSSRRC